MVRIHSGSLNLINMESIKDYKSPSLSYFAKYLPIEGEIKEGDMALKPSFKWNRIDGGEIVEPPYFEEVDETEDISNMRLAKLFLCSRNLNNAEKLTWIGSGEGLAETPFGGTIVNIKLTSGTPHPNWVNVIGEISSEATWVTENQEFTEDEIKRTYSERDYDPEADEADWYTYQIKGTDFDPKCSDSWHFNPIKIKCANCKTFH